MIDTGSNHSFIAKELLEELELEKEKDILSLRQTPENLDFREANVYLVHFYLPEIDAEANPFVTIGVPAPGLFENQEVIAVIGREILSGLKFEYNGKTGEYSIEVI